MNTNSANYQRFILTSDYMVPRPPGPLADGAIVEMLFTASGADRTLTFDPALVGSDPGLTIPQGETFIVSMRFDAIQNNWIDIRITGDAQYRFV